MFVDVNCQCYSFFISKNRTAGLESELRFVIINKPRMRKVVLLLNVSECKQGQKQQVPSNYYGINIVVRKKNRIFAPTKF